MFRIDKFPFNRKGIDECASDNRYNPNWPVVYLLEAAAEIYIGKTTQLSTRMKKHLRDSGRHFRKFYVIHEDESNESVISDIEHSLVEHMTSDDCQKKKILNELKPGPRLYHDKEAYLHRFVFLWEELVRLGLARQGLAKLRNAESYIYSPYKFLTAEQKHIVEKITDFINSGVEKLFAVRGVPGTGKTIVAEALMRSFVQAGSTGIALVAPNISSRFTLQKVFSKMSPLKRSMVIGPHGVRKRQYDVLIVDEAHKLKKKKFLSYEYKLYAEVNRHFGLGEGATQLDWMLKAARCVVLIYDPQQRFLPSNIPIEDIKKLDSRNFKLDSQMRILGGGNYIDFIYSVLESKGASRNPFSNYEFRIYDDIRAMVDRIWELDPIYGRARLVAGFAWKWRTKTKKSAVDFSIDGMDFTWNRTTAGWIDSPNASREVGCVHSVGSHDLNYTGVIVGPEMSYDPELRKIVIKKEKYMDVKGKAGVASADELHEYVVNIYRILFTRGVRGTFAYIVDDNLREYFKKSHARTIGPQKA